MNLILILGALLTVLHLVHAETEPVDNLVCTKEFCENELATKKCDALDVHCEAQNSTHSGIVFTKPTPCGCCKTCVKNMAEGDFCTVGAPGSRLPDSICGPSLYCTPGETSEDATCQKMLKSSKCFTAQAKFDEDFQNGLIGSMMQRPKCDDDGHYRPYHCIPGQICYCIDEEGNRIFGETEFRSDIETVLNCACSRYVAKLHKVIDHRFPIAHLRCDAMGSFDTIQCMDGRCLCVEAGTAKPTSPFRNFSLGLAELPCFKKDKHQNDIYFHDCEYENSFTHIIYEHVELGYNVVDFPEGVCQPDGHFRRIQEDNSRRYCADQVKQQIENFSVDRNSDEAKTMTCNCARARHLLTNSKTANEIPECCPNGNYKKFTCRRGLCYCLDNDGNQSGVEVAERSISDLECYNEGRDC